MEQSPPRLDDLASGIESKGCGFGEEASAIDGTQGDCYLVVADIDRLECLG
jgi:hypothetical protein